MVGKVVIDGISCTISSSGYKILGEKDNRDCGKKEFPKQISDTFKIKETVQ